MDAEQIRRLEPMADAAGIKPRDLQHFLAMHKWDEGLMRDRIAENAYGCCEDLTGKIDMLRQIPSLRRFALP